MRHLTRFFTVIAYCILASILFSSCGSSEKLVGYNISESPNTIDTVGYIFAVRGKNSLPISYITSMRPTYGNIKVGEYTKTSGTTVEVLANFLGVKNVDLTANTGLTNTTELNTTIKIENATLARTPLLDINAKVQEKKQLILDFIKNNPADGAAGYNYYVIIETVKSNNINISFDKQVTGNVTLDAKFQEIAKGNTKVSWDKNKKYQLVYNMDEPLVVLYKAYKINTSGGVAGGDFSLTVNTDEPAVGTNDMLYNQRMLK